MCPVHARSFIPSRRQRQNTNGLSQMTTVRQVVQEVEKENRNTHEYRGVRAGASRRSPLGSIERTNLQKSPQSLIMRATHGQFHLIHDRPSVRRHIQLLFKRLRHPVRRRTNRSRCGCHKPTSNQFLNICQKCVKLILSQWINPWLRIAPLSTCDRYSVDA